MPKSTPKVLQKCPKRTPRSSIVYKIMPCRRKVLQKCPNVLQKYSKSALNVLQGQVLFTTSCREDVKYSKSARNVLQGQVLFTRSCREDVKCSKSTPKVLQKHSKNTPKVLQKCPKRTPRSSIVYNIMS